MDSSNKKCQQNWRDRTSDNGRRYHQSYQQPQNRFQGRRNTQVPQGQERINDEEFEALFHVKNTYKKQAGWILPDISKVYSSGKYEFNDFQNMKNDLDRESERIRESYSSDEWSEMYGKYGFTVPIIRHLRREQYGHIVRHWPKAYEILSTYLLVNDGKLNSIHIGNMHGGMIVALNHYLHSKFEDVQWNWRATSANPYYEDGFISDRQDDRVISQTYKNWCFGVDSSGEIRNKDNINDFTEKCLGLGNVHLAILNSSIPTELDPDNKDVLKFEYEFAGLVAVLKILSNKGNLVMKSFNMFHAVNISVMFFLNMAFENVHMFKPISSSRGSFDYYIICLNFKKNSTVEEYIEQMFQRVGSTFLQNGPLFEKCDIPRSFLAEHKEKLKYFVRNYVLNMKTVKLCHEKPEELEAKRWTKLFHLCPPEFMQRFEVKNISKDLKLIHIVHDNKRSKLSEDYHYDLNVDCKLTFADLKRMDSSEQLDLVIKKFNNIKDKVKWRHTTDVITTGRLEPIEMTLEFGKAIERVRKTLFITPVRLYYLAAIIEETFDIFIVEHFPQENIICVLDEETSISYQFKGNYGQSERAFMKKVVQKCIDLNAKEVRFQNVLFLTHYSASILRILASFYNTLSVSNTGTIHLNGLKRRFSDSDLIKQFNENLNRENGENIMWFADLKHVNKGEYFKLLTVYNTQLIMQYLIEVFKFLKNKKM